MLKSDIPYGSGLELSEQVLCILLFSVECRVVGWVMGVFWLFILKKEQLENSWTLMTKRPEQEVAGCSGFVED